MSKGLKMAIRPSVPEILNDYSLDFSEVLREVTTIQARKFNILGFL